MAEDDAGSTATSVPADVRDAEDNLKKDRVPWKILAYASAVLAVIGYLVDVVGVICLDDNAPGNEGWKKAANATHLVLQGLGYLGLIVSLGCYSPVSDMKTMLTWTYKKVEKGGDTRVQQVADELKSVVEALDDEGLQANPPTTQLPGQQTHAAQYPTQQTPAIATLEHFEKGQA